jgi:ABC-type multidrug transport system fused ATPase/permease subunit
MKGVSSNQIQEYKDFLNRTIEWFRWHASKAMILHNGIRFLVVVMSASLPLLSNLDDRVISSVVAVVIAILTALDTQFKWGEEWRQFRSTQMELERLVRIFSQGVLESDKEEAERFHSLVTQAESVISTDKEKFFQFRIAARKEPN